VGLGSSLEREAEGHKGREVRAEGHIKGKGGERTRERHDWLQSLTPVYSGRFFYFYSLLSALVSEIGPT